MSCYNAKCVPLAEDSRQINVGASVAPGADPIACAGNSLASRSPLFRLSRRIRALTSSIQQPPIASEKTASGGHSKITGDWQYKEGQVNVRCAVAGEVTG